MFEIYGCDVDTPGFAVFFERLQSYVDAVQSYYVQSYFVDAATVMDLDDPKLKFFVA